MKKIFSLVIAALILIIGCDEKFPTPAPAPPPAPVTPEDTDTESDNGSNDEEEKEENETPDENGNQDSDSPFKEVTLAAKFKEDFSEKSSGFLRFDPKSIGDDFRYYSGHPSLSENNTKIMMMRVDPSDGEGWNKGPKAISKDYSFYGSYSTRMRIPDTKKAQKNIGAVAGLYARDADAQYGLSEIGIELRVADPTVIYLNAWTGKENEPYKISRTINLANGTIVDCSYGKGSTVTGKLTESQNNPSSISAVSNFDASKKFYTYGFDWKPDRITWWIILPGKTEKTILWDYEGKDLFPDSSAPMGIPVLPAYCTTSFWHSQSRIASGMTSAKEAPKYPFELEIDWMAYEPFDDLNNEWITNGNK